MRPQVRDYDAHGGLYALQRDLLARCRHPNGRPNELRSVRVAGTIPRTIEAVVRAHPHRTAICSTTQHISYRELNASTNQIAHGIRSSRPRSCRPVAVVASSGVPLITGMLAVTDVLFNGTNNTDYWEGKNAKNKPPFSGHMCSGSVTVDNKTML